MFKMLIAIAAAVWAWLRRENPLVEPSAAKVAGKLCCPLFYVDADGGVTSTWNYLVKEARHRRKFEQFVASVKAAGEVPAVAFLLTPNGESGLWRVFPNELDDEGVTKAVAILKELARLGIATLATLYVDDPSGRIPCWWEIDQHAGGWAALHARIGRYVSGYMLSIETNERAGALGEITRCIDVMRRAMPGAQVYGTHLQWATRTPYAWKSGASTPPNADLILAEAPWHISGDQAGEGDRQGVPGFDAWCMCMRNTGVDMGKVIAHEFNLRPAGSVVGKQRECGRNYGLRGVGG